MNANAVAGILGVLAGIALGCIQYVLLRRMFPASGPAAGFLVAKLGLWAAALAGGACAGPAFLLALVCAAVAAYLLLALRIFFRSR